MSSLETSAEPPASDSDNGRLTIIGAARCLLALLCSHVAAPYAAARLTIRFQLQGDYELRYALTAGAAVLIGAILSFRQLVNLPPASKWLYGITGIFLWIVVAFVLLAVAAESSISAIVLGLLWAGGSFWIAWTIWAYGFFRSTGVVAGSALVGLSALPFWTLVEAVGVLGSTRVEFAWRQADARPSIDPDANKMSATGAVTWPGYLGSNRDGVITGTVLREDWGTQPPAQLWIQNCGLGWSSFAVTETTLFGQEQLATGDCVTARDLNTGELLWTVEEERAGFISGLGGDGPRATPAIHVLESDQASRLVLFAVGPTGLVRCLDAGTGDVIWKTDLMQEFPGKPLIHGVCGSPLLTDGLVVVAPPTDAGPGLVAFHQHDGSLAWKCSSDWRASYASPARMTICDRPQIVLHAGPGVMGVNPSDGTVLWQYEWTNEFETNATQPLQVLNAPDDLLVATGYQGGVARIAIRAEDDGGFSVSEVWSNRRLMKTKFCNIAQFGDAIVGLDNAILCAVDVNTGKRLWKKGRYGFGQLLKVGEHLIVIEEKGDIRLLKPDTKGHYPIGDSQPALDRKTWTHPVLIDDRLIVRNDQQIVCLRLPVQEDDAAEDEPVEPDGQAQPAP